MTATVPSSLSSDALARRLAELAGDERRVQVDFLLHLDAFDQRRAWLQAGYESLWTYCLQSLHLREGPAGRRISAMRVLRRFPVLEAPLRDGRLCLSTVSVLGPLLPPENVEDLVARAAFMTKAEAEQTRQIGNRRRRPSRASGPGPPGPPSRPPSGARSGPATAGAALSWQRTGTDAKAPGSSSSTTSAPWLWEGTRSRRTFDSDVGSTTSFTRSRSSAASTWLLSLRERSFQDE